MPFDGQIFKWFSYQKVMSAQKKNTIKEGKRMKTPLIMAMLAEHSSKFNENIFVSIFLLHSKWESNSNQSFFASSKLWMKSTWISLMFCAWIFEKKRNWRKKCWIFASKYVFYVIETTFQFLTTEIGMTWKFGKQNETNIWYKIKSNKRENPINKINRYSILSLHCISLFIELQHDIFRSKLFSKLQFRLFIIIIHFW